ncbi:maleylpyruvate isomerase family mycothiol-dependent enzyme [Nocardia stercoris]|uniref:Maleylpyruvate isomerase family mycothiol-dependent enzyme n=1 Tax=Nocardia stercoris TaxID=2483361 RepID=A0A3M2L703_9NOCA|nr:maleylpyruvate isomerase family mycothiol-dependent enzyme [Nocardia stercoris]RMI31695.1 maleylpyruvate isomerase family mycothiol-dependent enzyme [Nocardia stercoris]
MSIAPDQGRTTALLTSQWEAIARLVTDLDEDTWRTPAPLPGWTVFDVVAHIVGTESMLLGIPTPESESDVTALPHVRNEIGAFNELWLEALRPLSGAELLARYTDVVTRRAAALTAMDDAAWTEPAQSPIGIVPYGRFMEVRLFDCWMHERDIADALGVAMDEDTDRGATAFGQLTATLGRSIGKGAQAPDGSRITVELTGPLGRTLHLAVGGRAEQVAELDGPATVTLAMPADLFARLRGGRTSASARTDEITITGDTALGERIVANLGFTI